MTRGAIVAAIALMSAGVAAGQVPAPGPAGGSAAATQMVRASGMPLPDGALPPGSLTVRLVQGAFTGDLKDVTVEIEVDGRDRRSAPTGEKGRAEFAHLPIGAQVRAWAVVNGERLESEPFPMPAASGVRVLLVTAAGGDTAAASGAPAHQQSPAAAPKAAAAPAPMATSPAVAPAAEPAVAGVNAVRVVVVSLTILAFVLVGAQQWRRRRT